ncbi:MAG: amidohydrolase family protein, partial [Acidobacteria bacterium]|nr:amidohydrolase family protein [Acidobacteriota bacterium]
PWNWQNAGDYLSLLEGHRPLLNVGVLQPHGPLRMGVLGLHPGAPDPKALDAMRRQLAEALDAGAFGLSTGLIYPPGMFSDTEELAELARVVARWDAVYTSHIRGSSETLLPAVEELLEVGRRSGARVHHSHNEAVGPSHWRRIPEVLEREEAALRQGVSISFDMFPYPAAATMMLALYPPWALEGGPEHLLRRLREPETRRRIQRDMEHLVPEWPTWREGAWPHNLVCAVGWKNIRVASVASDKNRLFENQSLAEVARRRGQSPFDAVSDLMLEERGQMGQFVFAVSGDDSREEFLELLARHPLGAFCTDANDYGKGKPHPGAYGAFPRVLARFVREKRVLTLEEAIHKMTSYPADLFRIPRRGRIEVGCFADLVVLEPEGVRDRASFENPRAFAEGILQVWINGVQVVDNSRYLGIPAGRVLRKSGGSC